MIFGSFYASETKTTNYELMIKFLGKRQNLHSVSCASLYITIVVMLPGSEILQ